MPRPKGAPGSDPTLDGIPAPGYKRASAFGKMGLDLRGTSRLEKLQAHLLIAPPDGRRRPRFRMQVMERSPWEPEGVDIVLGPGGTLDSATLVEGIDLVALYRHLLTARHCNLLCSTLALPLWASGAGEEAILAATASLLQDDDWVYPGARDLSLPLLRGLDFSELLGQLRPASSHPSLGDSQNERAPSHRLGGRGTHSPEHGVAAPAEGLGLHLPIATGQARAQKLARNGALTVALCGEGLSTHGVFHESLSLAVSAELPFLLVVKSHVWPDAAPPEAGILGDRVRDRAAAMGLWSHRVDGADPIGVYREMSRALEHIRDNQGPALLEVIVTPLRDEVPDQRDPLHRLAKLLEAQGQGQSRQNLENEVQNRLRSEFLAMFPELAEVVA